MRRRYDLRRGDNYLYTGKISYVCSGDGDVFVYTGFPVTRATVSWVVYPFVQDEEMSSSSRSTVSLSSDSSSSSSSSVSDSSSSRSFDYSSSCSSSESSSSSSDSSSMSSSSDSTISELPTGLPRIYVSSYSDTGFMVTYENVPSQVGYIEFSFNAV